MGEVVGAAMVAHVPTIVMDETERRELNAGQEISLSPVCSGCDARCSTG